MKKMCDCLDKFKEYFLRTYPEWKGKEVKGVSLSEGYSSGGAHRYYIPIYIDIGNKKPKESFLLMQHCPMCGASLEVVEQVSLN